MPSFWSLGEETSRKTIQTTSKNGFELNHASPTIPSFISLSLHEEISHNFMKKHEYISEIKNLHLWHKLENITFINNPAVVFMSMMPLLADCMDTFATKIKN